MTLREATEEDKKDMTDCIDKMVQNKEIGFHATKFFYIILNNCWNHIKIDESKNKDDITRYLLDLENKD